MSIAHQETDPTGLRLIIESDDDPMNPRRQFDNCCRIVCWAITEGRTMLTACVAEWHRTKAEDLAEALLDERPDLAPIGQ